MAKSCPPRPTDAELAILRVLWRCGPSTVRQVQEALDTDRPTGYTTALKLLQIMTDKGLVLRDAEERSHVYRPRLTEAETQKQLVGDLADRAFGGSAKHWCCGPWGPKKVSSEELAQIRELLDKLERGDR